MQNKKAEFDLQVNAPNNKTLFTYKYVEVLHTSWCMMERALLLSNSNEEMRRDR